MPRAFKKSPKKRGRPPKKAPLKKTLRKEKRKERSLKKLYLGVGLLAVAAVLFFNSAAGQNFLNTGSVDSTFFQKKVPAKIQPESPIKIAPELLVNKKESQHPQRILIPKLNIDLYVVEAKVVNGYWETSETVASHGMGSGNPGELGNIVISAHAREGMFENLRNVQKGDQIYLLTKDSWYRYSVSEIKEVRPNQLEVISPTADETLTLYTCTGFTDEKRLIVVAKPSK